MSTAKIAQDSKYAVGSSTDTHIASTPATLYYENQFSFLPPAVQPASGAVQRCDVYNTASVRGLLTHLDLNFDLVTTLSGNGNLYINSFAKLFEYVKIYLDNVEVMWLSGTEIAWLNLRRNQILDSMDENDFEDRFVYQGGGSQQQQLVYLQGTNYVWDAEFDAASATTTMGTAVRVQIPLDMLTSFLFHKWDTRNCQKISVEIKYRNDPGTIAAQQSFVTGTLDGATPAAVYNQLQVSNAFITQRAQLYTDPAMFKPISQMYTKPLIKTEKQVFSLPTALNAASTATFTATTPMSVRFRLADSFSIHKRCIGMAFTLNPDYSVLTPGIAASWGGQCWQPIGFGARIYKGGKLVEDLSNFNKCGRQSNHFYRCLGSKWVPSSATANPPSGGNLGGVITGGNTSDIFAQTCLKNSLNLYQGVGNNMLSFLDRGLAESNHADNASMTKVQLIGGISNAVEENWEIEILLYFDEAVLLTAGNLGGDARWTEFTDQLNCYLLYTELLGVQPSQSGGPASIKVYS